MHKTVFTAALLTGLLMSAHAQSQSVPQQVTLPQMLDLVRTNNLNLQAERIQVEAAEAGVIGARTLPNPTASFGRKPTERDYFVDQPLPLFGQRGTRIRSAETGVDAAQKRVERAVSDVLHEVTQSFTSLLIAQERGQRWQEAEQDLRNAARIVAGQVESGTRSPYDLARISVEQASMAARVAEAQADMAQISARLAEAAGFPSWRPMGLGSVALPVQALGFEELWPEARRRLPTVRAALADEAYAKQRIEVARRDAWPVPSFGMGGIRNDAGRDAVIGVSVSIPIFDRNQGPIAQAQAEARELNYRSMAVIHAAETELRRAIEQSNQRKDIAARFERDALTVVPRLRQMAEDAYRLGRGGILEMIDAIQAAAEKRIAYLDLLESALKADVEVQYASGSFHDPLVEAQVHGR